MMRARRGIGIVEILAAVAVLGVAMAPIVLLGFRAFETVQTDTLRLTAESLCHNTIERFGRAQDMLPVFLKPTATDPEVLEGVNLWEKLPDYFQELGPANLAELAAKNGLKMRLLLKKTATVGVDSLICEVWWTGTRGHVSRTEKLSYARMILHDHVHSS